VSGSKIAIIKIAKIAEDIIVLPVFQVHFVNGDWSREVDRTGAKHQGFTSTIMHFTVFRFSSSFVMAPAASSAPLITSFREQLFARNKLSLEQYFRHKILATVMLPLFIENKSPPRC
jgi:hypothetical protein